MMRQEVRFWLIHVFYLFFFVFLVHRVLFISSSMWEQTVSCALYPFLKVHTNIARSLQQQADHKKTVQQLQQEVQILSVEQTLLRARLAQMEAQQIFIAQSQEVVDFAQRYDDTQRSLASVLLYYSCPQEDVIFIDGGRNRGFNKDDVVIYQNVLIGRVIETYAWYSKVALVTDQRCRVSAIVGSDSAGVSCGKNNGEFDLCFVPHYKKVEVGDLVVSTGQGLMYPQGFVVGVIASVSTDLVSHQIVLKPYVDMQRVTHVYVFKKLSAELPVSTTN